MKTDLAKFIDHTLLKPDTKASDIARLCREAKEHGFKSVCVNPCWVPKCREMLAGTKVAVCTVIGFPLGATSTFAKVEESLQAIDDGADELDVVINQGLLKSDIYACFCELSEIVRECLFVDNTAYIRALENVDTPVFLRPKRFGKSVVCSCPDKDKSILHIGIPSTTVYSCSPRPVGISPP